MIQNSFRQGLQDGVPIALGYCSVSFAFGMMCVNQGIPVWMAALISLTNLTSAGQFAGLGIMAAGGSLLEMALSQFIINLRYFLMSLTMTQKVDPEMSTPKRAIVAYGITDEIFALSSSKYNGVGFAYMMGLIALPVLGWTLGTILGGAASSILPMAIRDALGIMIYGMFCAIIIPPARKERSILVVVLIAAITSSIFQLLPIEIGSGFVIILCTLLAAGLGAFLFPIKQEETR